MPIYLSLETQHSSAIGKEFLVGIEKVVEINNRYSLGMDYIRLPENVCGNLYHSKEEKILNKKVKYHFLIRR